MASAAAAPTSAAATAIMVAHAATDTANDQKCSQPRILGLISNGTGPFPAVPPVVTPPVVTL